MIKTPTKEQIKTLKDYTKQLQSVRDNITLNDAEIVRLRKLKISEEYTVKQLHNSKKALESEIEILKNDKKELKSKSKGFVKNLERAEKAFNDKMVEVKKAQEKLAKVHEKKSKAAVALKEREDDLVQKELNIKGEKEKLIGGEKKLEKSEQRVDLKIEKIKTIKDFIEKILEE